MSIGTDILLRGDIHGILWAFDIDIYRVYTITSQQTRDVDPPLIYCWASVDDARSTLKQHWCDVWWDVLAWRCFIHPL